MIPIPLLEVVPPWAITLGGVIGSLLAAAVVAYRGESTKRAADQAQRTAMQQGTEAKEAAEAVKLTEQARKEHLELLMEQNKTLRELVTSLREQVSDHLDRIKKLEASEELCQEKVSSLTRELGRYTLQERRRGISHREPREEIRPDDHDTSQRP